MPVYTTSNIKIPNNDIVSKQLSSTSKIFEKYKFRYFIPIISNPEALQKIFTANSNSRSSQISNPENFTTIEKLSEALQSTTIKAKTTLELIEDFKAVEGIEKYLKITYLKHSEILNKLKLNGSSNETNNLEICNDNNIVDIIIKPVPAPLTVNFELTEESKKNRGSAINEFPKSSRYHNKSNPGLSVIQILDPDLRACLKHSQETSVFFNLINTLDMSMAIPYLNIKFIIPAKYTQKVENSESSRDYFVASFNNFFFGSSNQINQGKEKFTNVAKAINGDYYIDTYTYAKAIPAERTTPNSNSSDSVNSSSGAPNQTDTTVFNYINTEVQRKEVDISLFTMPQSLVNGDENLFGDYNAFTQDELKNRDQPVHDKFRPFMSIESVDFDVRPTKELMSFKTATINMVLYDKSRLNEILAFVKPDLFGSFGSEILLQYGWQHTLGDPEYTTESNPIAEFINSLKCYEKYQIINSSYSIQENGQVNISLNISMKGPSEMRGTPVNKEISSYILNNKINSALELIKAVSFSDTKGTTYIDGKELTISNDNLSIETLDKLDSEINVMFENASKNLPINLNAVKNGLQKSKNDLKAQIAILRTEVKSQETQIEKVLNNGLLSFLNTPDDPFLNIESYKTEDTRWKGFDTKEKVISLGKILTGLLGKLITTTYQYDEVQLVFFNLNEKAIRARCLNIAAIPVDKEKFNKWFVGIMKNASQMSIEGLVNIVLKRYVNEKAAELYGLNNWLKLTENSETKYIFEDQQKKSNNSTGTIDKQSLNNANASILDEIRKQYYGEKSVEDTEYFDLTFKLPLVKMTFDTMIHDVSDRTTILRINFYDENDNPFESMFDLLGNFQNKELKKAISTINYLVNNQDQMTQENFKRYKDRTIATINSLLKSKIIEFFDKDNNKIDNPSLADLDDLKNKKIRIVTTNEIDQKKKFMSLKSMFKELLPSITFGAPNSAAISANVSSMNDPKLSTVFMTRDEQNSAKSSQYQMFENQNLMPTRIIPSQVSAKIIGCPIIHFGQMLFFDFNTNTTVDNAYVVTGIKHSISPGKFETDLTLSLADGYARFLASSSTIKSFLEIAKQLKDDEERKKALERRVNIEQAAAGQQRQQKIDQILNQKGNFLLRFSINKST